MNWLLSIALRKGLVRAAQAVAAVLAAQVGHPQLAKLGISVAVDPNAMAAALVLGSEVVRSWLKMKYPKVFGWL